MNLLNESGERWMEPDEQFRHFPSIKSLRPSHSRPVWLVLSLAMREMGYRFANGLGISGQMDNMRKALD